MSLIQSYEYIFANPFTEFDLRNHLVIKYLKRYNPSLLLYYYRRNKNLSQALTFLLTSFPKTHRIKEEIVYTYLYFKDYKGALEYIKYYEFTNKRIKHLEEMIKMHFFLEAPTDLDSLYKIVRNCLSVKFVKDVLETFVAYCRKQYPEDYESRLRAYLQDLSGVFSEQVLSGLSFEEAKLLYKAMPEKAKYLKVMVRTNPYIKKKYYFQYAKIFGIEKEDIVYILTNVYREWAFRIALDRRWFTESMRSVIEQHFGRKNLFIYKSGKWEHNKNNKGIMFLKQDYI